MSTVPVTAETKTLFMFKFGNLSVGGGGADSETEKETGRQYLCPVSNAFKLSPWDTSSGTEMTVASTVVLGSAAAEPEESPVSGPGVSSNRDSGFFRFRLLPVPVDDGGNAKSSHDCRRSDVRVSGNREVVYTWN
jgi:hypothetical protein